MFLITVLKLAPQALFWPENSWLDSHELNAHVCSLDKTNGSPMGKAKEGTARPTGGGAWGLFPMAWSFQLKSLLGDAKVLPCSSPPG